MKLWHGQPRLMILPVAKQDEWMKVMLSLEQEIKKFMVVKDFRKDNVSVHSDNEWTRIMSALGHLAICVSNVGHKQKHIYI